MKKISLLFFLLASIFAVDTTRESNDLSVVQDWISSKRMVTIRQLGGYLSISGDVRTAFVTVNERKNNIKQIGPNSQNTFIPDQAYKVTHNFLIDYRTGPTWSSTKVRIEYNKHTITDSDARIKLERAILGARVHDEDNQTIDLEFGRSKINYSFDSRIQFTSYMDGALVKWDGSMQNFGDPYFHFAAFIINEFIHQYGFIGEIGVLDLLNTGLYCKYSLVNWDTKRQTNAVNANRFRFVISQITAGYNFIIPKVMKSATIYSAYLVNTQAKPTPILLNQRLNIAWYAGFTIGRLSKRGDWSVDGIYEYVQAQCIPEFDLAGIKKGNSSSIGLYSTLPLGLGASTTRATAVGSSDYQGFSLTFAYLISSNLSISQSYRQSSSLGNLVDSFHYKVYYFEMAYAF